MHDDELEGARTLIHELYDAGVDAPDRARHGDFRAGYSAHRGCTPAPNATFAGWIKPILRPSGVFQLVLARELTLKQIREISTQVDAGHRIFYSRRTLRGLLWKLLHQPRRQWRSANRGDCSQACRLPYTLKDEEGRVVAYDKHLLSMKDNNQTDNMRALVDAGVRSFKIEGRYKDMGYVKKTSPLIIVKFSMKFYWNALSFSGFQWPHRTLFIPDVEKTSIVAAPIILLMAVCWHRRI